LELIQELINKIQVWSGA